MENIGLLIEFEQDRVKEACLGLAAAALGEGHTLSALVVDAPIEAAEKILAAHGVDRILRISTGPGGSWNPAIWTDAIVAAMQAHGIASLIGLTSQVGREILPRIAARLDAPLVMDCIQIDLRNHEARTSQYSGKVIATIALKGHHRIYGLRANVIAPKPLTADARVSEFQWDPADGKPDLAVIETRSGDEGAQNLAEADIIISGGRGMKNGENFRLLYDCARKMGAAVGASRVAVDNGWVPYALQVGQTGVKVNPKVYLACGISGSVQHYAGMKTSQMIIALNSDENAAIISNCDYYAIGDLFEILPELAKALSAVS